MKSRWCAEYRKEKGEGPEEGVVVEDGRLPWSQGDYVRECEHSCWPVSWTQRGDTSVPHEILHVDLYHYIYYVNAYFLIHSPFALSTITHQSSMFGRTRCYSRFDTEYST